MKSRILKCITVMTLFGALAIPVQLAAQKRTTHFRHYKLIDIGTFGAPASYINPADTFGSPNQVNARGTAVGGAFSPIPATPTSNGFICFGPEGIEPFVNHALEWKTVL